MRTAIVPLVGLLFLPLGAAAQEPLECGRPLSRPLPAGAAHVFAFDSPPGTTVVLQTSDVGGTLGLIRMEVTGPGGLLADTCVGVVRLTVGGGPTSVRVSQCRGAADGRYTISLNGVSDGAGNCGMPLSCGATPDGVGFDLAGEADSFALSLTAGTRATLRVNYTDTAGAPSLRLYDPDGEEVALEGRCAGQISVDPSRTGVYTALVSACGAPLRRPYRIELSDDTCPAGPVITTFAVANAANEPLAPLALDEFGRPVFHHPFGQGLSLVLEARAGANRYNPGLYPAPYFVGGVLHGPDMEMIVSRPLGDGDPLVCDTFPPQIGGVPATVPFTFSADPVAQDVIHDLGCRFADGTGQLVARQSSIEACTRSDEAFGFGFVDRGSRIQFCGLIASAWSFPLGDTVVGARIKDGNVEEFGAPREIVVRIGDPTPATPTSTPPPTPTATPSRSATATRTATPTRTATLTRTATPPPTATRTGLASSTPTVTPPTAGVTTTPTLTATPTATPPPVCAGDCNADRQVTIGDLTVVLNVAIGQVPLERCPPADASGDGEMSVGDVIACVGSALNGCP